MTSPRIRSWRPGDLPGVVRFWNLTFADRRNFFAIAEEDFSRRVTENETGFDPEGLFLALEGPDVVGMAHAVRSGEEEGRIAFLAVDPGHRRRGTGGKLLDACRGYLRTCQKIALDGQCFTPYYGNAQGPFLPFWGTPEGVSIPAGDEVSIEFFGRRGFSVRFEAVTMERRVLPVPAAAGQPEVSYRFFDRGSVTLGGPPASVPVLERAGECFTWAAVVGGEVAGIFVALSLDRAVRGMWGVHELHVAEAWQGRSIGAGLLARALATLADRRVERCEVLTIPVLSPGAYRLYGKTGFDVVARWAIF